MAQIFVEKELKAAGDFSDPKIINGKFNFSVIGVFVATVTVQRRPEKDRPWGDVDTYTSAEEAFGEDGGGSEYRFGIKAGQHTSGQAVGRLWAN